MLTKIFHKRLRGEIYAVAGVQIFVLVVAFLSNVIWTRFFSMAEYGVYQLTVSIVSFVTVFALSGLNQSLSISARNDWHSNFRLFFLAKFKVAMYLVPVFWVISWYFFLQDKHEIGYTIAFISFAFPLIVNQSNWEKWLIGSKSYTKYAKYKAIAIFCSLMILLLTYYLNITPFSALFFILILLIINTILNILINTSLTNSISEIESFSYGKKLTGAILIGSLLHLEKFFIDESLTIEHVAIFSVAMIFPDLLRRFFSIINKILIPRVSSYKTIGSVWEWYKEKFIYTILIYLIIASVGFFLIDDAISFIFPDSYSISGEYAKWLFVASAIRTPISYLGVIMVYQKKLKYSYAQSYTNVITKIGGILLLLPLYGLWGVVYAHIISMIATGFIVVWYFVYYLKNTTSA